MFWFYLGGITVAVGIVYALYARKGSAFAREPADQPEDEEGKDCAWRGSCRVAEPIPAQFQQVS